MLKFQTMRGYQWLLAVGLLGSARADTTNDDHREPTIFLAEFSDNLAQIYPERAALMSVDPWSGKLLWKFECGGVVFLPKLTRHGIVMCSVRDKALYCVDPRTGKKRWSFQVGGQGTYLYLEVSEDMAFISSWHDNMTYAVKLATGEKVWEFFEADGFMTYAEGRVFMCSDSSGRTFCLDARTGEKKWEIIGGGWNIWVSGRRCYIPAFTVDKVMCVDVETGKSNWETTASVWHLMLVRDRLYTAGYSDGLLRCLDADSGKEVWQAQTEAAGDYFYLGVSDRLVFGGRYHTPTAAFYDAANGKELARLDVGNVGYGYFMMRNVQVIGSRLYFANPRTKTLTCYTTADFGVRWEIALPESPVGTVESGTALIVGAGKEIRAIRLHDGSVRWKMDLPDTLHYVLPIMRKRFSTF